MPFAPPDLQTHEVTSDFLTDLATRRWMHGGGLSDPGGGGEILAAPTPVQRAWRTQFGGHGISRETYDLLNHAHAVTAGRYQGAFLGSDGALYWLKDVRHANGTSWVEAVALP